MRKLFRRFFIALGILTAVILVVCLIIGPIWELSESHQAALEFPPPGRLVKIDDRRIQIDCRGAGNPTVVFESGLDILGSLSWTKVHEPVAQFTRACTYSRAGIIWSDDKHGFHDGPGVARDLHAMLAAAGERGPFVLVGHSLGGPYITIYTKLFGDEVAGLVYVDASHPDQQKRMEAALGKRPQSPALETALKVAASVSWMGVVRLGESILGDKFAPNTPAEAMKPAKVFASKSLGPMLSEMDSIPATLSEVRQFRTLGARPIAVLTHMEPTPEVVLKIAGLSKADGEKMAGVWLDLQNDMASWSSRSDHRIFNDAGHYIQFDRPDAVIAAIQEVVESIRSGT